MTEVTSMPAHHYCITGNGHSGGHGVMGVAEIVITLIVKKSERKHYLSNQDNNSNRGT